MEYSAGFLFSFIINFIFTFLIMNFVYRYKTRPIVMPSDQWLDISTIPPDVRDFLVTDGSRVESFYLPYYNSNGKLKIGGGSIASHWMPFPMPPDK